MGQITDALDHEVDPTDACRFDILSDLRGHQLFDAATSQSMDLALAAGILGADRTNGCARRSLAEGHLSMYGSVGMSETDVPMIEQIKRAGHRGADSTHYIRGWAQRLLAGAAIEQALADSSGDLTGDVVRQAMCDLDGYSPGGLVPSITFSPDDHRPNMVGDVYRVENGRWVKHWENALDR